jgi:hypothetical protein
MNMTRPAPGDSLIPRSRARFAAVTATVALAAVSLLVYFVWLRPAIPGRDALLASMPEDARALLYIDLAELRREPFFDDLLSWAPKPDADQEYRQFVRDTGFDYERDLDRVAVAFERHGARKIFFVVGDGHFDMKKIKAYADKNGAVQNSGGAQIFSLPVAGSSARLLFTFLTKDRLAITNHDDFGSWLHGATAIADAEWRERFSRVAGSPVFAVIRSEALKDAFGSESGSEDLTRRATGGFSSPQLSSLLAQLQWVTAAGKPQNNKFRVVLDAESVEVKNAQQLTDLLNGVVLLAREGLSNARPQQRLGAPTRQSYLALLKSVEVSRIDRPDTKSVRLVFDVTPDLLKSAPTYAPAAVPAAK